MLRVCDEYSFPQALLNYKSSLTIDMAAVMFGIILFSGTPECLDRIIVLDRATRG